MTMKKAEEIPAGLFKATCLAVLDRVAKTKAKVVVTKHGRPVAQVLPISPRTKPATLLGSVTYRANIVDPLGESWDVDS